MKFLTIILSLIAIKSCGVPQKINTNQMISNEIYSVTTFNETEDVSSFNLTISFNLDEEKISGFAGCNRYSGIFTIENEKLSIGPLMSTEMYCTDGKSQIEAKMHNLLDTVNTFEFVDDYLILKQDDTELIKAVIGNSNERTAQTNDKTIIYKALSRGTYLSLEIKGNTLSYQKSHSEEASTHTVESRKLNEISRALENISLESLSKLEPPSKKHQFDGAEIASLEVITNETSYKTPAFDHGNPPKEISTLVELIISLTPNKEKQ